MKLRNIDTELNRLFINSHSLLDIVGRRFAEGMREALMTFKKRPNTFLTEIDDLKSNFKNYPERAKKLIYSADKICTHSFDLLGSGEVFLGDSSIDWHVDFKTGYRWDQKKFYKDIEIPYGKGDIKVPWELSRFQHLTLLGQAYWISSDEKYAREFIEQIMDWITKNPVKCGPNWACTMDVAIRVTNWLVAWEFFKKSPSIDNDFIEQFLKSLLIHGRFIRDNLEYSEELTSNHYLSDIAGLFFIAAMVPEFKESEEWLTFSKKELEAEIVKQVYRDGCDFEASTCYHRLVLELFYYPALLGRRRGRAFSQEYIDRLKKMFEAVYYLLKPNGKIPQIGDNDSGRFLRFEPPVNQVLDMRYLLAIGAVFFNVPHLKVFDSDDIKATILSIYGREGLEKFNNMKKTEIREIISKPFSDSGWFVMRKESDYLLVSCGPNGQNGNGGHAHNDKLSFELHMNGKDIFVDPGTYVYTADPAMRNLFRSTSYHNTVIVNNLEQNEFNSIPYKLFQLKDRSRANVILWESNGTYDHFIGEHFGYDEQGFHHVREIYFRKQERLFEILDRVTGQNPQSIAHFHLSPNITIDQINNRSLKIKNIVVRFAESSKIDIVNCWYSKEYGDKKLIKRINVYFKDFLKTDITYDKF